MEHRWAEGKTELLEKARISTWTGIGHIIVGMHRQGYDVQLTQYDERSAGLHGSNPM